MIRLVLLVLVLPLLATACSHTAPQGEPERTAFALGDTVALLAGQTGVMQEGNDPEILVRFDEVVEDSRCPEGVECVWEGEVTVAVTLFDGDGGTHELQLTLPGGQREFRFPESPARQAVMAWDVQLLSVLPYPREGAAPREPVATFRLEFLGR